MVTQVPGGELTTVERSLVEHVGHGEWLDLAADDEAVDEAAMRSWGDSRTCRATVIRDILRGRLVAHPDPHGLRLRGARITGQLDLAKLTTDVSLQLRDCLLEAGIIAQDARLASMSLSGCQLECSAEPPLYAEGLTCTVLDLSGARIIGNTDAGAVRLVGAHIVGSLYCQRATLRNGSGPALNGDALQVSQSMFIDDGFTAAGGGEDGAVRLVGAHVGISLNCGRAALRNNSGPALVADGLRIGLSAFLRDGFTATGTGEGGAVRLVGASIGGQFSCIKATLRNDSGPALLAEALQVGQNMFLTDGFTATGAGEVGAIRLTGARIGGSLDCTSAALRNDCGPALVAHGLQVGGDMRLAEGFVVSGGGKDVALDLKGARVDGTLVFDPGCLEHSADRHRRLAVDGLTYAGVPEQISGRAWLELLRDGTPSYAAQPYRQLAAGYRSLGAERQTRGILMAQREDELTRTDTGWPERLWGKITKVTLGYGYQPWRALLFLAVVVAISCLLAVALGSHGALAQTTVTAAPGRPCTVIQRLSVGLDLNLPVGASLARAGCELTGDPASATGAWLAASGWVLGLLAWVFAALFIAGFTSAVRKT